MEPISTARFRMLSHRTMSENPGPDKEGSAGCSLDRSSPDGDRARRGALPPRRWAGIYGCANTDSHTHDVRAVLSHLRLHHPIVGLGACLGLRQALNYSLNAFLDLQDNRWGTSLEAALPRLGRGRSDLHPLLR